MNINVQNNEDIFEKNKENKISSLKIFFKKIIFCISKKSQYIAPSKQKKYDINVENKITQKFTRFISILMLVMKAITILKWNSKNQRSLKFVNEREIKFINDITYQTSHFHKKAKISFIKNKFIRTKIVIFKKKFKQFLIIMSNFLNFQFILY